MEANFFRQINSLDFIGDLQLTISKGSAGQLIVAVLLRNENCEDQARQLIPPMVLREQPEALDKDFFEAIGQPLQQTSTLMSNMAQYLQQVDAAKKQSAMEREKTEAKKREQEAKAKKYRELMQKVDELEKEGKFKEAWMKLPDPQLYTEKAEEIRRKRTALSAKFAPDLFGEPQEPAPSEEASSSDEQAPEDATDDPDDIEEELEDDDDEETEEDY